MRFSRSGGAAARVTKRLSFSRRATADLNEIWDYTEERWGREQAYAYVSSLVADCRAVLAGDKPGQTYEHISGALVRIRSGAHAAFLNQAPDGLRVVRVIHLKRDVVAELD